MTPHLHRAACLIALLAPSLGAQSVSTLSPELSGKVDRVFAAYTNETPGCAVGIGQDGRPAYTQGYGLANLEYGVPITDQTIFESGSVAKQFTAGAIVMLALDGKLNLDADVRKYIPEVPSFGGQKITLRNLLNHTSGIRDQWALLGIKGEPPGQRVHSPAVTVDLVAHQQMLNFPAGSQYLYSNTGWALLGVVVERVSGKSLDAFTQERIFGPLGMTHTQWRDDFTKIVKNRATAYSGGRGGGGPRTDMPFTNMIGNGGLLFTVGDVLKWLANLDNPAVGGPAWRDSLQVRGRLTSGKTIPYALGLIHATYNGQHEIAHSGSTAGYQTWIGRFPDRHLAIAVLCNTTGANPTQLAHRVADIFLPPAPATQQSTDRTVKLTAQESARWAGLYRDSVTDQLLHLAARDSSIADVPAAPLQMLSATKARGPNVELELLSASAPRRMVQSVRGEDTTVYKEVPPPDTSAAMLAGYVGTYLSDELDYKLAVAIKDGKLVLLQRPSNTYQMRPTYRDDFSAGPIGTIRFARNAAGAVTGFSIYAGRAIDVRFKKVSSDTKL